MPFLKRLIIASVVSVISRCSLTLGSNADDSLALPNPAHCGRAVGGSALPAHARQSRTGQPAGDDGLCAVDEQLKRLEKLPSASDYFAQEALVWGKQHPDDPRDADVLGFATRVVRNGCRGDATKELNQQLFDVLHSRFPRSQWALRYTTWE